jgi:hypothetical protein
MIGDTPFGPQGPVHVPSAMCLRRRTDYATEDHHHRLSQHVVLCIVEVVILLFSLAATVLHKRARGSRGCLEGVTRFHIAHAIFCALFRLVLLCNNHVAHL